MERDLRESATRLGFTRARPKAVFYARPPVDVTLGRAIVNTGTAARDHGTYRPSRPRTCLVVIGPYRALIVEPGGEPDVADILGIADAQLLELFSYNDRLDAELPRMYDRVEHARQTFAGLARRRHGSLARSLHSLLAA